MFTLSTRNAEQNNRLTTRCRYCGAVDMVYKNWAWFWC